MAYCPLLSMHGFHIDKNWGIGIRQCEVVCNGLGKGIITGINAKLSRKMFPSMRRTLHCSWKRDKLDANEIDKGDKEEQGLGWQVHWGKHIYARVPHQCRWQWQGRADDGAARAEAGGCGHAQAGVAGQGQVANVSTHMSTSIKKEGRATHHRQMGRCGQAWSGAGW